jgi:hypothetical protein
MRPVRFICAGGTFLSVLQQVQQPPREAARPHTYCWLMAASLQRRSEPVNAGSGTVTLRTRPGLSAELGLCDALGLGDELGPVTARFLPGPA